jgi:glycine/D-amino acid oxidase-like deaminating enzyme
LVDTICQGYCYAPIDEYKAAFAVPIYPQTLLRGAAQDSDLLRHGSDELPKALFYAYRLQRGKVELGCEVTRVEPGRLQTSRGEREADAVVFAATADHPLYDDLLPPVTGRISYTRFVPAVVATDATYHPEVADWGAIFFAPRGREPAQVLSMISLEKLYDTSELRNHYTVNVRVPARAAPLSRDEVRSAVGEVLPQGITVDAIPTVAEWPQAMPVSSEELVETMRALQGIGGRYFAGDFLGCPSMEVAVRTGIDAAEMVLADIS